MTETDKFKGDVKMDTVVEAKNSVNLAAFDEVKAAIEKYKIENENLVFDYDDAKGNKDARSHVFKLRQVKSQIAKIHNTVKSEALAVCKQIDVEKNTHTASVEEMIQVHMVPIKAIEERKLAELREKAEVERAEKVRIEKERLDAIAQQEAELEVKHAELKAKEAAAQATENLRLARIKQEEDARHAQIKAEEEIRLAKVKAEESRIAKAVAESAARFKAEEERIAAEREKFKAEKRAEADARDRESQARMFAKEKAEREKAEAVAKAEREKAEAVEAEKEKARKVEADRLAKIEAEKKRLAGIEARKVFAAAGEKHRKKIERDALQSLVDECLIISPDDASIVIDAIKAGKIKHVTINY